MNSVIGRLRESGVSEGSLRRFEERFAGHRVDEANWAAWVFAVDDSDYGWEDWVNALLRLEELVKARASSRSDPPFSRLVGYVSCTVEGARGSGILEPLPDAVAEAFETYGFIESD